LVRPISRARSEITHWQEWIEAFRRLRLTLELSGGEAVRLE
jgi:hypothetical protein